MKYFYLIIFCLFLKSTALAGDIEIKLSKKYEPAVVKIITLTQGIPLSFGSGFFISKDGLIVTNKHVVQHAIDGNLELQIKTIDDQKFTDVSILGCDENAASDLCVLKLNFHPKSFFNIHPYTIVKGTDILVIGHPVGYEYTLSSGIVSGIDRLEPLTPSATDKQAPTAEYVQITAPISPGNSGGPVFDKQGNLVGVSTLFRKDAQNLNFALSVNEVLRFIKASHKQQTFLEYKREQNKEKLESIKKFKEQVLDPIIADLKIKQPLEYIKSLSKAKPFVFDLPDRKVEFLIPFNIQPKEKKLSGEKQFFFFQLAEAELALLVMIEKSKPNEARAKNGKVLNASEPSFYVQSLMKAGSWEKIKKTMTPEQIANHFSKPGPFNCTEINGPRVFWENSVNCHAQVDNFGVYGGVQFIDETQINDDNYILKVIVISSSKDIADSIKGISQVIIGSAQIQKRQSLLNAMKSNGHVKPELMMDFAVTQLKNSYANNGKYSYELAGLFQQINSIKITSDTKQEALWFLATPDKCVTKNLKNYYINNLSKNLINRSSEQEKTRIKNFDKLVRSELKGTTCPNEKEDFALYFYIAHEQKFESFLLNKNKIQKLSEKIF